MNEAPLLLTDLYQLTMLQAYHDEGMNDAAVFEFFVRKLPESRNFLVAAGLEQSLDYLETARFCDQELDWLRRSGRFRDDFLDALAGWRFTGDVDAMAEGTVFFPDEPILRVVAPLREAQVVETRLINLLHFQTVVASKAARCVLAARGRALVDFGLRPPMAPGGPAVGGASFLAGFSGNRHGAGGHALGHPAVRHHGPFLRAGPRCRGGCLRGLRPLPSAGATLLIDTLRHRGGGAMPGHTGARAGGGRVLAGGGAHRQRRLAEHARRVACHPRCRGLHALKIFASGNLDECASRRCSPATRHRRLRRGPRMNTPRKAVSRLRIHRCRSTRAGRAASAPRARPLAGPQAGLSALRWRRAAWRAMC